MKYSIDVPRALEPYSRQAEGLCASRGTEMKRSKLSYTSLSTRYIDPSKKVMYIGRTSSSIKMSAKKTRSNISSCYSAAYITFFSIYCTYCTKVRCAYIFTYEYEYGYRVDMFVHILLPLLDCLIIVISPQITAFQFSQYSLSVLLYVSSCGLVVH